MPKKIIRFGVVGGGLMGREFVSAVSRWCHLLDLDFEPRVTAVCDTSQPALKWFQQNVPGLKLAVEDYGKLLESAEVDAVYCAVPHRLHEKIFTDILKSGKHLLGEKPFGIDLSANRSILKAVGENPGVLARCSSEFPFYPGAYRIARWFGEGRFGKILDVESGFWHSSDLDPAKPANWKRRAADNGEYGCMGDLGMHACHLPLRFGWKPKNVRALLTKVYPERPDGRGGSAPSETWDNAILACEAENAQGPFPLTISMKRIAPGHGNTWFLRINSTTLSVEFSTKNPKRFSYLPYASGEPQEWRVADLPYESAYKGVTGHIFEFGFSDSILQMIAAFCDESVNGGKMLQPFRCATPEETGETHKLFTVALESQKRGSVVEIK
jgi:predicted dehydrogenase